LASDRPREYLHSGSAAQAIPARTNTQSIAVRAKELAKYSYEHALSTAKPMPIFSLSRWAKTKISVWQANSAPLAATGDADVISSTVARPSQPA
jgi:hypothetical protein